MQKKMHMVSPILRPVGHVSEIKKDSHKSKWKPK